MIEEKHQGHDLMHAEMILILFGSIMVAQILLFLWRQKHGKSYQVEYTELYCRGLSSASLSIRSWGIRFTGSQCLCNCNCALQRTSDMASLFFLGLLIPPVIIGIFGGSSKSSCCLLTIILAQSLSCWGLYFSLCFVCSWVAILATSSSWLTIDVDASSALRCLFPWLEDALGKQCYNVTCFQLLVHRHYISTLSYPELSISLFGNVSNIKLSRKYVLKIIQQPCL